MFWFNRSRLEVAIDESLRRILVSVENNYHGALRDVKTVEELTESISKLTIQKSQIEEKYEKREREIEHKLGLERQRQEQELALSIRDAKLKVKEENLELDRKRFEEQMKFTTDRFTTETGYLKDMIKPLLDALPKMKISQKIE